MGAPQTNGIKRQHHDADDFNIEDAPLTAAKTSDKPANKRQRVGDSCSLFVRSIPKAATNESLAEFFSQHFPVKHAVVVQDKETKESRGYGFVTFADAEDTKEAQKRLNNIRWENSKIRIDIAERRTRKPGADHENVLENKAKRQAAMTEALRPPKLIIRNLPWSIKKSEQLAKLFAGFGKVKYSDLPNDKGKLAGYGFITMRGHKNAEKALKALNSKEIDGRSIAVDWAVNKETYQKQIQEEVRQRREEKAARKEPKKKESNEDEKRAGDEDEFSGMTEAERDVAMFFKNTDLEFEKEKDISSEKDATSDEDDDNVEIKGVNDKENYEDEQEKEGKSKKITDNSSTIFVRNLPFTATDESLKIFFDRYGAVRYARVVMDRATDRPAGTGFVCFFDVDDCVKCIKEAPCIAPASAHLSKKARKSVLTDESADPTGRYTMDGRILQVTQAVSKDDATRLASEGAAFRREKDKRHLFLLNEGALDMRSSLYKVLSPSEIKMREASMAQRKKLVQSNPMLHISLTRLAVRNIPKSMSSKELKQLARKACVEFAVEVKDGLREPLSREENTRGATNLDESKHGRKTKGTGIVKQAKIEFESVDGSKMPENEGARSRGYGFIEFSSHRWALIALRWLNGYAVEDANGKKKRLIVEFAIENAQVVARRAAQIRNSRAQQAEHGVKTDKKETLQAGARIFKGKKDENSRKAGPNGRFGRQRHNEAPGKTPKIKHAGQGQVIARKMVARKRKVMHRK